MSNATAATQNRATDGKYDHKNGALCVCGHPRGEHTARGAECIAADFHDIEICECTGFKKAKPAK